MSTDWGIGCRTCRATDPDAPRENYFTGEFDNCRDVEAMTKLAAAAPQIVAAYDAVGDMLCFQWSEYVSPIVSLGRFCKMHEGHSLAAMNEYGRFADE